MGNDCNSSNRGRILIHLATEVDARLTAFGEPGVAHHSEDHEIAVADQPMQDQWREVNVLAGFKRELSVAVVQVMKLDRAAALQDEVRFIRYRVHVRAAAEQAIGRRTLRVDVDFGQPDPADQTNRFAATIG